MCPTLLAGDCLGATEHRQTLRWGFRWARVQILKKVSERRSLSLRSVHGKSLGTCTMRGKGTSSNSFIPNLPPAPRKPEMGLGTPNHQETEVKFLAQVGEHHGYSLVPPGLPASPDPDAVTSSLAASGHTELLGSPPSAR